MTDLILRDVVLSLHVYSILVALRDEKAITKTLNLIIELQQRAGNMKPPTTPLEAAVVAWLESSGDKQHALRVMFNAAKAEADAEKEAAQ